MACGFASPNHADFFIFFKMTENTEKISYSDEQTSAKIRMEECLSAAKDLGELVQKEREQFEARMLSEQTASELENLSLTRPKDEVSSAQWQTARDHAMKCLESHAIGFKQLDEMATHSWAMSDIGALANSMSSYSYDCSRAGQVAIFIMAREKTTNRIHAWVFAAGDLEFAETMERPSSLLTTEINFDADDQTLQRVHVQIHVGNEGRLVIDERTD